MQPKTIRNAIGKTCLIMMIFAFCYSCQKDEPLPTPYPTTAYEFNTALYTTGKKASQSGLIEFRQNPDTNRVINLDTWVRDLLPNHDYSLQRAVNPITDADCTSTAWLTLGEGLTPYPIHTDAHGNGFAPLWRDVTSIARGTAFRIHFQVIDAATLATVLVSDCEEYTVR